MKIFSGFFVDQSKRLMVLGVIVLILLTSEVGIVSGAYYFSEEDCPPCKECGMKFYNADRRAFHETFPPYSGWEALNCAYHKLDEKGDSLGSGAFGIKLYTDEGLAMEAFLEDVENARNRIDKYENSKQIIPDLIEDTPFDAYEYRIIDLDNNFYEITGIYLLNKYKIYVSTEYHEELADAEKAFDALKKCAFSTVPEGKGNHPPKVTLTFLGYKPGPHGGLGSIEFEAKATDEDGDKLRFRWFRGSKELKEENNDIVTKAAEKDGMTTVHLTMLAPPVSGSILMVFVYDDRGGKHWTTASWYLPPGTGIPVHDLPTEPYIEAAMGKVTLNGKEILPGGIYALSPNDVIETAPGKTNGGYAIINIACLGGTVKIGSNTHLRFYNKKQLGLFSGKIRIDGKEYRIRKKSGGVFRGSQPPDIEVVGPETVEQMIESIEDKELREEWRDKINQIGTGAGIGKWAGTEFEVIVEEDGTTIFHVFEDVVDVSDVDMRKTVAVGAGETTIVKPNGVPSDPEPFDPDSIDRWWGSFPFDTIPSTTDIIGLTFESRSKSSGSTVQIPLTLKGIEEKIGNMDITLGYDSSVLEATEVTKGDLTTDSLFEYNIMAGTILISLADTEGFSGNGTIAYVTFNVTGAADSTSPLLIAALAANRAEDYEALTIPTNDGVFRVEGGFTVGVSDTTGAKGSTVEVPINLEGATEVGSMDIVLNYDADVLSAVDVETGALGKNALIESNTARDGAVIIALADSSGINGDGTVASVAFEVIGDACTTSALTLEEVLVYNLDLGAIIPNTVNGTFLVI